MKVLIKVRLKQPDSLDILSVHSRSRVSWFDSDEGCDDNRRVTILAVLIVVVVYGAALFLLRAV